MDMTNGEGEAGVIKVKLWRDTDANYLYGSHIVPSAKTPDKIYIAGSGYSNPGVYQSYDNGQSFTPIDSGLPKTMIYEIAVTPDDRYIFAATEIGPYVYIASQNCWFDMAGLNAPDQTYWSVEYLPGIQTARFGTYGRGIWDFKINSSTNVIDELVVSQKLTLSVNPNPVNNNSIIYVESNTEQNCTIRIFDFEGKHIKLIYEGKLEKGLNQFNWNGCSNSGKKLTSGTYICVASSMGISNFCKLIIE